jgi:hypothetical protein
MDLAAGCAEWVSAAGREAIDLSDAKGFAPRALESD